MSQQWSITDSTAPVSPVPSLVARTRNKLGFTLKGTVLARASKLEARRKTHAFKNPKQPFSPTDRVYNRGRSHSSCWCKLRSREYGPGGSANQQWVLLTKKRAAPPATQGDAAAPAAKKAKKRTKK